MLTFFAFTLAISLPQNLTPTEHDADRIWRADFATPVVRVVPLAPDFEIIYRSGLTLPEDVQAAFDTEFATGPYFGAFAIAKDFSYGYVAGTNDRAAAIEIAKRQCALQAPATSPNCIIYAEALPVGYVDIGPGDLVLSPDAATLFQNPGNRGKSRAMAASADGAYSMVWDHATQAEADAAAVADCEQYRTSDLDGLSPMPCRVLPGLP